MTKPDTNISNQDGIVRISVPIPVPELHSLPRWRVFVSLFNPKMSFHTCKSLKIQLHKETQGLANLYADKVKCWSPKP